MGDRFHQLHRRRRFTPGISTQHCLVQTLESRTLLSAAVITTPDGLSTPDPFPTINWNPIPDAAEYQVWFNHQFDGFRQSQQFNVFVDETEYTPTRPLKIGHNLVFVRGHTQDGTELEWSDPVSIFVTTPMTLDPLPLRSTETNPVFSWAPIREADSYQLWIDNVTTGQSQVPVSRVMDPFPTNKIKYTPTQPLQHGSYNIWIRAFSNTFPTEWSVQRYHLGPQPVEGDSVFSRPVFKWVGVPGVDTYELYLDTAEGVISRTGLTDTTWQADADLEGTVHWWVRGFTAETAGPWSTEAVRQIGYPKLQSPSVGTDDPFPAFNWTHLDGATRYELYVSAADARHHSVFRHSNLTGSSFEAGPILPDGNYLAWIRAFDGNDNPTRWSLPVDFTIQSTTTLQATVTPVALPPVVYTQSQRLTWVLDELSMDAADVVDYELYLTIGDELRRFFASQTKETWVRQTSFVPSVADEFSVGSGFWWVRAIDQHGNAGPWSQPAEISIDGSLVVSNLRTSGQSATPLFEWQEASGATAYDFYLQKGELTIQQTVSSNSWTPPAPLESGRWQWWVRARDDTGNTGQWTGARHIVVLVVTPIGPFGTIFDQTPTFEWEPAGGAGVTYEFRANGSGIIMEPPIVTSTTFRPIAPLQPGKWTWWVRAIDASGNSFPSTEGIEIFVDVPLVITAPVGTLTTNQPTFEWTPVQSARFVRFILHVQNRESGDVVLREESLDTNVFTALTPFETGSYRVWVKWIQVLSGVSGPWSPAVDFTVV